MTAKSASFVLQRRAFVQFFAMCLVLPLCVLSAHPFLETLDWGQVGQSWSGITPLQWSLAILVTAASFTALGQYDVIVQRILNTRVSARTAQASGAAAVALSQTLGFGLVIGTLARWRGLHHLDLTVASEVTALVSISFLGAWLTLFALSGLLLPHSLPLPTYVFQASLFSVACFTLYKALKRHITVACYRTRSPSLRAVFALMCFAAIDAGFAALAFWVLIPSSADIVFAQLFPIYLVCLGVALVSNTPAGVGPLELTLLWAIPDTNINELLAALIAFHFVYFALPASLGMLYMFSPLKDKTEVSRVALFTRGLHPETSSALQTEATLIAPNGQIFGATARTTQSTTLLFEPAVKLQSSLTALSLQARTSATIPLFYKCDARTVLQLCSRGLFVVRIAQDGLIDLKEVTLETLQRRTLRRKLRKIEK